MTGSIVVTVRLTPEQIAWLEKTAQENKRTISWVIRDSIDMARLEV